MSVLPDEMQKNEHIRKAAELCERAAFTPEELLKYDAAREHIRIEKAVRDGTRREALAEGEAIGLEKGEAIGLEKGEAIGLEKGEAIGLEKGEAIGLEKGEAIGLEKGKAIGEANLYKAIDKAHKEGYSIEAISTIFGLSQEEIIKKLKKIQDEGNSFDNQ